MGVWLTAPGKAVIFKEKDSISKHLQDLEMDLHRAQTEKSRARLQGELAKRRAGDHGEREAAYYIDFHLKAARNWAVIHDFRIQCKGRVAQIDHLIISRVLEIYVVE